MKIRVLQVFASLDMGGAESRMMDVYRSIDNDSFDFDFITLQQDDQYYENEITELGGKIYKLRSPREIGIKKHIQDLRQCIRNGNYDAVHAHTSYHCGIVMYAAYKEGVPVRIAHARTNGSIQNGLKTMAFIILGRYMINRYSTNRLAISDDSGRFVFGNSDFSVIPNSIDLSLYENVDKAEVKKLFREFNINDNDIVIGHIGRFDRFKNQRFVIDVFNGLFKLNRNAKLILVGDGELKSELEKYVKKLGIENSVIFTGIRSDVPILLNCFNILLFPSIIEGLGGVVLEAQAAGVPAVISENVPSAVDIGLGLVKSCSLNEPIECWIELINNSCQIDKPEYNVIEEHFSNSGYTLEASVNKYSEIYRGKPVDQ